MYLQQQVTGAMLGPPALNALNAPAVDLPGAQTLDQIGVVLLLTGAIVLIVAVVAALIWRKKKKEAVPVENQQSPLPR
jgi:4-amino-4-deoxy-L-arabinose transferase-like glycosyltransferase